jgi:hypothetical protein
VLVLESEPNRVYVERNVKIQDPTPRVATPEPDPTQQQSPPPQTPEPTEPPEIVLAQILTPPTKECPNCSPEIQRELSKEKRDEVRDKAFEIIFEILKEAIRNSCIRILEFQDPSKQLWRYLPGPIDYLMCLVSTRIHAQGRWARHRSRILALDQCLILMDGHLLWIFNFFQTRFSQNDTSGKLYVSEHLFKKIN